MDPRHRHQAEVAAGIGPGYRVASVHLTGDLILDELLPAAYPDRRIMREFVATVLGGEPERLAAEQARPTAVLTGTGHGEVVHGKDSRHLLAEAARRAGDYVFTHLEMPEAV